MIEGIELQTLYRPVMLGFKMGNPTYIVGQKIKKSPGQKNSWNHINQFHEEFFGQISFFAISKMAKNQFLNWEKV